MRSRAFTRKALLAAVPLALALAANGCRHGAEPHATNPATPAASLPPDQIQIPGGDAGNGEVVFVSGRCANCHTIHGRDLAPDLRFMPEKVDLAPRLATATRSELTNAILNPRHAAADPSYDWETMPEEAFFNMRNFAESLTVGELSDLVAFLETAGGASAPTPAPEVTPESFPQTPPWR